MSISDEKEGAQPTITSRLAPAAQTGQVVREAMACDVSAVFRGTVEIDETYGGWSRRCNGCGTELPGAP